MYSFIRPSALVVVVACSASAPSPQAIAPSQPAPVVEAARAAPVPGPLKLHLSCVAPHGCSHPPGQIHQNSPYTMDVGGDQFDCRTSNNNLSLVIRSSQDPSDRTNLHIEGFNGAGRYQLDRVLAKSIDFSTTTRREDCRGGTLEGTFSSSTAQAGSPDTCGSRGCVVEVADPNPLRPFPKPLEFRVTCPDVCTNGGTYRCTATNGPIDFAVSATCGNS